MTDEIGIRKDRPKYKCQGSRIETELAGLTKPVCPSSCQLYAYTPYDRPIPVLGSNHLSDWAIVAASSLDIQGDTFENDTFVGNNPKQNVVPVDSIL